MRIAIVLVGGGLVAINDLFSRSYWVSVIIPKLTNSIIFQDGGWVYWPTNQEGIGVEILGSRRIPPIAKFPNLAISHQWNVGPKIQSEDF